MTTEKIATGASEHKADEGGFRWPTGWEVPSSPAPRLFVQSDEPENPRNGDIWVHPPTSKGTR